MKSRHGPTHRAIVLGACVLGVILAFGASSVALGAEAPKAPSAFMPLSLQLLNGDGPVAVPIKGADRYLTAVEASKKFSSATTVVVASGETFPDALGGAALAGAVDGPLLLTPKASVPSAVLAEIDRLGATKVYVLGGTGAVSAAAYGQLAAAVDTVVRLGGNSRYETAQLVADETIRVLGDGYSGAAFMATGLNFPDALAASPIMYAQGMPLVLVDAAGVYTLPAETTHVTILGGTGAVPASVQTALGAKFENRIAGSGRYATAAAIAQYGVTKGMSWNNLGVATGESFPDALCAGPLVGSKNAVLLLTASTDLSTEARDALVAHKGSISQYYLFGGESALSSTVVSQVAAALAPASSWSGHSLPDVSCTASGCHDTELATIHIAKGCYMCHSATATPSNDCIACHGETVHDAAAIHADIVSVPAKPEQSCSQAACHGTAPVTSYHADCAQCHASTDSTVRDAISNGGATCETCHDYATVHVDGNAAHTVGGDDCYSSTCHGTDVSRMHAIDFRGTGDAPPGCAACHGEGVTPTTNCLACHQGFADLHDATSAHADIQGTIATNSAGCVSCHGSDLMKVAAGEHVGCTCHAYAEARGADACEDCHEDPMDPDAAHPYHVGAHDALQSEIAANSAGCVSCHGSDLLAVLPADNPVTHRSEHAGCSCHAYHEAEGQMACEDCHVKPMDPSAPFPYHVGAHDEVEADIAGENSAACVSCHGTNLLDVSAGSPHIAGEHKGCSCHAYGEATEENSECVNCHDGAYAPHGFVNGVSHTGNGWIAASGHSTTSQGKRGVYEDFSGLGILDSNNATPTAQFPFPTVDVFWSADDTSAPAGAIKGLTKDSVITCEDCHTGLVDVEINGPQGAGALLANAGIDPAFPGTFEEAYLWAGPEPGGDTTISSGIAKYIPGGETEVEKEELVNWTLEAVDGVGGTAQVLNGNDVICAKCHDLYNDGTGIVGWSNYGHEHHATRPVNNFGKFDVGDGGATMPTQTVIAESRTAALAEVPGASIATTITAPSLGREGAGACRDCHVAIPHGWKRPRLIVYYDDPAPYNAGPSVYEGEDKADRTSSLLIGSGQMNGLSSTIGPTDYTGTTWTAGLPGSNKWTSSQCNACGHHNKTNLSAGAWK